MRGFALLLLSTGLLWAGPARFARLGEFEGTVEVQLQAADAWMAAQRNLPLPESAWLRTGSGARLEVEFDDGAVLRLGPDTLAEISDLARLSTGQRVTILSLDHGIAYFTGQAEGHDAITLALPGAQVTVRRGARLRLQATSDWSQASTLEGSVRFSSPAAEFDLAEGQTARVEPAHTSRFFLFREVAAIDLDKWNEQRDKFLASTASGRHVPAGYGLADLDAAGEWVETADLGAVWKPKPLDGWAPFRNGRWQWYDAVGYTWVSDDTWGWLPSHYGRWTRKGELGWVWAPPKSAIFKPGDVFWLRGAKIAGWGPLAPGEEWSPKAAPLQFLNANTTWADFQQDARVIDPAGFAARPKEPLGVAAFMLALPSPALLPARLEVQRPLLRAGTLRVVPVVDGASYQSESDMVATSVPNSSSDQPVAVVTNPGSGEPPVVVQQPGPPPGGPVDVLYPAPVYTGIIVVNPPERDGRGWGRNRGTGGSPAQVPPSAASATQPAAQTKTPTPVRTDPATDNRRRAAPPVTTPPAVGTTSTPTPAPPRTEPVHVHHERPATPTPPAKEPDKKSDESRPAAKVAPKTP